MWLRRERVADNVENAKTNVKGMQSPSNERLISVGQPILEVEGRLRIRGADPAWLNTHEFFTNLVSWNFTASRKSELA